MPNVHSRDSTRLTFRLTKSEKKILVAKAIAVGLSCNDFIKIKTEISHKKKSEKTREDEK